MSSDKTDGERLAAIETTLGYFRDTFAKHILMENAFHEELDSKVDQLLLARARDEGERKANRRLAGVVSFVVSICVAIVAAACNFIF